MILCSVYDSKTKMYSLPVCFATLEDAKRAYAFTINDLIGKPQNIDKSLLYFKKDMFLYVLCGYDQENEDCPLIDVKPIKPLCLDDIYEDYKDLFQTKEEALPEEAFVQGSEAIKQASGDFVETLKDDEITKDELVEKKTNLKKSVINLKKKEVTNG